VLNTVRCADPPLPVEAEHGGPKPRSFPIALLLLGIAVVGGLTVRDAGPGWSRIFFRPLPLRTLNGCAACFVALVLSVVLHELGHLAASLALGFEVTGASIGPFRVSRLHGCWMLQVLWRRFFRGSVTAIPRNQHNWRPRMLIAVAAGPIATGLTAAAAWAVALRTPVSFADGLFAALLQINVLLFVLGFVPTPAHAPQANDARLFLVLFRFDGTARNILLYHVLTMLRIEGRRPREYPEWIVRRIAVAGAQPAMQAAFAHAIADWAVDRGDLITAAAWNERLGRITANCPVNLCYTALAHSACLDIMLQGKLQSAEAKLARVPSKLLAPKWLKYRSLAVGKLATRDGSEALANIRRAQFHQPIRNLPYFAYERLLLNVLRSLAIEAQNLAAHS
jgi:Zn-dependent protease